MLAMAHNCGGTSKAHTEFPDDPTCILDAEWGSLHDQTCPKAKRLTCLRTEAAGRSLTILQNSWRGSNVWFCFYTEILRSLLGETYKDLLGE